MQQSCRRPSPAGLLPSGLSVGVLAAATPDGPVLRHHGRPVVLRSSLQRQLLLRLGCAAGELVSRHELVEVLWPHHPPGTAEELISSHVARLRRLLSSHEPEAAAALPRSSSGYRLEPGLLSVDLAEIQAAATDPRADPERQLVALRHLVGPAGSDLADEPWWCRSVGVAREQARELCRRLCTDADGEVRPEAPWPQLVPALRHLAEHSPYDEPVIAWLADGLAWTGRCADAVRMVTETRRRLVDELGTDPSPPLQQALGIALRSSAAGDGSALRSSAAGDGSALRGSAAGDGSALRGSAAGDGSGLRGSAAGDGSGLRGSAAEDGSGLRGSTSAEPRPPAAAGPIGREQLVLDMVGRLATAPPGTRWWLSGPVGVGSSAVAAAVVARLAPEFPGGVLRLDLARRDVAETARRARYGGRPSCGRRLWWLDHAGDDDRLGWLPPGDDMLLCAPQQHPDLLPCHQVVVPPLEPGAATTLLASLTSTELATAAADAGLVAFCEGLPTVLRRLARRLGGARPWSIGEALAVWSEPERRLVESGLAPSLDRLTVGLPGWLLPAYRALADVAPVFRTAELAAATAARERCRPGIARPEMAGSAIASAGCAALADAQLVQGAGEGWRVGELVAAHARRLG